MSFITAAVIGGVGALAGGALAARGAKSAAQISANSADAASANQLRMYEQQRADQQPWMQAGQNALGRLTELLNSGSITSKFAGKVDQEPGYQFGMEQGLKGIQNYGGGRSANSGESMKAAGRYATDYATTKYNDAFNRYWQEQQNTLDPLYRIAGYGPAATNQVGQAGQNYANQSGNYGMQAGAEGANSAAAVGNIYGNVLGDLGGLGYSYFKNRQQPPMSIWDPSYESSWTGQH